MIINIDGKNVGGPLDVWCILEHERFHVAYLEERPLPGPIKTPAETPVVRLQSKMHHTDGHATLEEALAYLDGEDGSAAIEVPAANIWREPLAWDGEPFVTVVPNWVSS